MQYRDSEQAGYVADQATKRAKVALVHYLWLSIGQAAHGEGATEIEAIVDDIVEAAVARIEKVIHAEREANPLRTVTVPEASPR